MAGAVAPEVHLPYLLRLVGKTQTAEGNGEFGHPALVVDLAGGLEDQIVADVLPSGGAKVKIALDPQGIAGDFKGRGAVPVGVQAQNHVVVAEDPVALTERGPDGFGIVVADEGHVQVLGVVGHQDPGVHRGLDLVAGAVLGEILRPRRRRSTRWDRSPRRS